MPQQPPQPDESRGGSPANSFGGVDAVQALLNALYALSVEAEMSEENQTGELSWGGQRGPFGFPAPEADPERTG